MLIRRGVRAVIPFLLIGALGVAAWGAPITGYRDYWFPQVPVTYHANDYGTFEIDQIPPPPPAYDWDFMLIEVRAYAMGGSNILDNERDLPSTATVTVGMALDHLRIPEAAVLQTPNLARAPVILDWDAILAEKSNEPIASDADDTDPGGYPYELPAGQGPGRWDPPGNPRFWINPNFTGLDSVAAFGDPDPNNHMIADAMILERIAGDDPNGFMGTGTIEWEFDSRMASGHHAGVAPIVGDAQAPQFYFQIIEQWQFSPEPSSLALVGVGIAAILSRRRRGRRRIRG